MNHFIRLPIDLVKVDRRLIAYLPIPGKQAAILQTIFDLGRMLEVRMLAEGIERKEQLEALLEVRLRSGPGASVLASGCDGEGAAAAAERPLVAFRVLCYNTRDSLVLTLTDGLLGECYDGPMPRRRAPARGEKDQARPW